MSVGPKVCANCGSEINENENFCMSCGWVREGAKIPKHLQKRMKKEKITLEKWFLLCLCLTPCGALIYWFLTQGE